jgi:hypothetical protein
MADEGLRELERAWTETGQLEDGERLLLELARAGAGDARREPVQRAVLTLHVTQAGFDASSLARLDWIPDGLCYRLTVPGRDAVAAWKALRKRVEATGYWPLLLGPEEELAYHEEALDMADAEGESITTILAKAERADDPRQAPSPEARRGRLQEQLIAMRDVGAPQRLIDMLEQQLESTGLAEIVEHEADLADWPDDVTARHSFATPTDLVSGEFHAEVVLGLLPTGEGAQAPAWLRFGGWNDCPFPAQHVKVFRDWKDRFGAEPLAMTHDVVELWVEHPPTSRDVALDLAREQYQYCSDVVEQGVGTAANLAAGLLGGTAWYFWWD